LEEYKNLIENTKCDLANHLQNIQEKLQIASAQGPVIAGLDAVELQLMEDEKSSTKKSLEICEQFLSLVDQSRPTLVGEVANSSGLFDRAPSYRSHNDSWLINAEGLNSTFKEITSWKLRLLQHLYGVDRIVQGLQRSLPYSNNEQEFQEQSFREEMSGTETLLNFCKRIEEEEANRL
jgi:hypothetical protein